MTRTRCCDIFSRAPRPDSRVCESHGLAAAFLAGALYVLSAAPAAAQDAAVWSADLTPRAYGTGQSAAVGCTDNAAQTDPQKCTANPGTLSQTNFLVDGNTYSIHTIAVSTAGTLKLIINASDGGPFNNGRLFVGSSSFDLPTSNTSNGATVQVTWANSGLSLTAGTKVRVSLELTLHGAPPAKPRATKVDGSTSATTLEFRISCGLHSGAAPGTDYVLRLRTESQSTSEYLRHSIPIQLRGAGAAPATPGRARCKARPATGSWAGPRWDGRHMAADTPRARCA